MSLSVGKPNNKNKRKKDLEDSSVNRPPYISKKVDSEDAVAESTRVLRVRNLQKKKKRESSDEEGEVEDGGGVDSSDFDVDDAKDEDWDVEFEERELHARPGRDTLGRFKRRNSGKKQRKSTESLESGSKDIGDESLTEAKDGVNTNDSDKSVRVNFIYGIKACEKGIHIMEGRLEPLEEKGGKECTEGGEDNDENCQKSEQSVSKSESSTKKKKNKSIIDDSMPYREEAKKDVNFKVESESKEEVGKEQDKERLAEVRESDDTKKKAVKKSSLKKS